MGDIGGNAEPVKRPAKCLHRGMGPVGGQLERGRYAGERLAPVRELPLELGAGQPAALPQRIVCILDRELRQLCRGATQVCLVERSEVVEKHVPRPAVAADVMADDHQRVLVLAQPDEHRPRGHVALEVERPAALPAHFRDCGLPSLRVGQV
jgi:hypothetical protein